MRSAATVVATPRKNRSALGCTTFVVGSNDVTRQGSNRARETRQTPTASRGDCCSGQWPTDCCAEGFNIISLSSTSRSLDVSIRLRFCGRLQARINTARLTSAK